MVLANKFIDDVKIKVIYKNKGSNDFNILTSVKKELPLFFSSEPVVVGLRARLDRDNYAVIGRRFYIDGKAWDANNKVINAVNLNYGMITPMYRDEYVRISTLTGDSNTRLVSCLERCMVNGRFYNIPEVNCVKKLLYLIDVFNRVKKYDEDEFNNLVSCKCDGVFTCLGVDEEISNDGCSPNPIRQEDSIVNRCSPNPIRQEDSIVNRCSPNPIRQDVSPPYRATEPTVAANSNNIIQCPYKECLLDSVMEELEGMKHMLDLLLSEINKLNDKKIITRDYYKGEGSKEFYSAIVSINNKYSSLSWDKQVIKLQEEYNDIVNKFLTDSGRKLNHSNFKKWLVAFKKGEIF